MKQLILASQSPRRKMLLKQIGLQFEVYPSNMDEILNPKLSPRKQVEALSKQKAEAVASKFNNAIILAADTMVSFNDEMIGKPKNAEEAELMLKKFSGTHHSVVTGFTLFDTETKKMVTKSTESKIWFKKMTNEEIEKFIEKEKPFDKAGAYAVLELASIFIERIEGDFFGIVGLSIFQVTEELKKFGISVL